jgi:hypothetical protein
MIGVTFATFMLKPNKNANAPLKRRRNLINQHVPVPVLASHNLVEHQQSQSKTVADEKWL